MNPIGRREFLVSSTGAAFGAVRSANAWDKSHEQGSRNLSEWTGLSATQLARKIRRRELSVEEVIEGHIARIEQVDPTINAVVYKAYDEARAQACQIEAVVAKGGIDWHRKPLLGVPVTIKDNLETAQMPTTCGAPGLKDYMPKRDATVVSRLKDAGAIILGKTNLPCMAFAYETNNLLHRRTMNPYGLDRTTGGSSGGEAAIIAACGSPLGIGNDSGGSIRIPSAWCGICGALSRPGEECHWLECIPLLPMWNPFSGRMDQWHGTSRILLWRYE
jgi:amidase